MFPFYKRLFTAKNASCTKTNDLDMLSLRHCRDKIKNVHLISGFMVELNSLASSKRISLVQEDCTSNHIKLSRQIEFQRVANNLNAQ